MRKILLTLAVSIFISLLSGCAKENLNAPCPNFGASCHKAPVNGWDHNQ